ncbi:MAG: adenylylsulfate kinase / phosphoadenylylsulfate reductase (thioredoxin) [Bryobacterales bacterium]|jgi:phosphoadenosine phosphosulfate reductase|nr:adenylylsulfate kinase / phosphoadenylylsulfate reductase (thioredoxin) [Bryobacterales bacterium]
MATIGPVLEAPFAFQPSTESEVEFCGRDAEGASPEEILAWAIKRYGSSLALSTSFQREGMVILDMAARITTDFRVFTLDTGRLPDETHQMIEAVRARYGVSIEMVSPDAEQVRAMVSEHGPNLFYRDVPHRMLCCHIRKTLPLERKLGELSAYIVGLRREQTQARSAVKKLDLTTSPAKISPLADWTRSQVEEYTSKHSVPTHPLYANGYTSIGCAPCTRAPRHGECGERDGRWWWEQQRSQKECGLHFNPSPEAQNQFDVLVSDILTKTV